MFQEHLLRPVGGPYPGEIYQTTFTFMWCVFQELSSILFITNTNIAISHQTVRKLVKNTLSKLQALDNREHRTQSLREVKLDGYIQHCRVGLETLFWAHGTARKNLDLEQTLQWGEKAEMHLLTSSHTGGGGIQTGQALTPAHREGCKHMITIMRRQRNCVLCPSAF